MPKASAVKRTDARISRLPAAPEGKRTESPDALAPGLILHVTSTGWKEWQVRHGLHGRQQKASLGTWPALTLAQAREDARKLRAVLRRGVVHEGRASERRAPVGRGGRAAVARVGAAGRWLRPRLAARDAPFVVAADRRATGAPAVRAPWRTHRRGG